MVIVVHAIGLDDPAMLLSGTCSGGEISWLGFQVHDLEILSHDLQSGIENPYVNLSTY